MSTPLYDALVEKVRSWANRDSSVLTDSLVGSFLDYSEDHCYSNLRVSDLEYTHTFPAITQSDVDSTSLTMPTDVLEIIQFSKKDSDGKITVFNERASIAALQDKDFEKGEKCFTRKGTDLIFENKSALGDVYELFYYRREPKLNNQYAVTADSVAAGNATQVDPSTLGATLINGLYYVGKETPNWLRDTNERIVLFGALAYAFEYVGEDERAAKFFDKQRQAIAELNADAIKRKVKGGSLVTSYSGLVDL